VAAAFVAGEGIEALLLDFIEALQQFLHLGEFGSQPVHKSNAASIEDLPQQEVLLGDKFVLLLALLHQTNIRQ